MNDQNATPQTKTPFSYFADVLGGCTCEDTKMPGHQCAKMLASAIDGAEGLFCREHREIRKTWIAGLRFRVHKHLGATMPAEEVESVLGAAGDDIGKLQALLEVAPKTHPGAEWTAEDEKDLDDTIAGLEEEPKPVARRLNARGEELAGDYRRLEQSMGGCQCHLNPPCSLCMHEGNPDVLADDETAWEEEPGEIAAREIGRCAICGGKVECVEQKWFHLGEVPLDHEAMYGGVWNQLETTRLEGRSLEPGEKICDGDVHGSRQNFRPVPREWIGTPWMPLNEFEVFRPVHPILTKAQDAAPLRVTEYHDVTDEKQYERTIQGSFPDLKAKPAHRKSVAFDFDGVLHSYSRGWHDGTCYDAPVPGALEFLLETLETMNVFILSTRDPLSILTWVQKHLPPFTAVEVIPDDFEGPFWNERGLIGITQRKLAAEFYIDDRAVRFRGDWAEIREAMKQRPWNEAIHSGGNGPKLVTNREAHEKAAGMGLAPEFFTTSGIDPNAPAEEKGIKTGFTRAEVIRMLEARPRRAIYDLHCPNCGVAGEHVKGQHEFLFFCRPCILTFSSADLWEKQRMLQAELQMGGYAPPTSCTEFVAAGLLCDKPAIATRQEGLLRKGYCAKHLPTGRVMFLQPATNPPEDREALLRERDHARLMTSLEAADPKVRKEAIARFCGPAIPSKRMGLDDAGAFALERQSPSAQAVEEAAGETAGNRPVIPMDLRDKALPERLSSGMFHRIHEDLGTASMCWDPIPAGVFDSTNAGNIAFNLCHAVADEIERCKNGAWRMGLLCGLFLGFLISAATVFFWK